MTIYRRIIGESSQPESGFSLVEIVVAMFVLAALSLALVPALVAGLKQSASNAVLATASSILSARLDSASVQSQTCLAVSNFASAGVPDVVEPHGITLRVVQNVGACPTIFPGTIPYTVTVRRVDTNATLITTTTLLYVEAAN